MLIHMPMLMLAAAIDTPLADWIYAAIVVGAAAGALVAAAVADAVLGGERGRDELNNRY